MSDLKRHVEKRKKRDRDITQGYKAGYEQFKVGAMLRQARIDAGMTQEELAHLLKVKREAVSRIENHTKDIKLSTLERIASALGKQLEIRIG